MNSRRSIWTQRCQTKRKTKRNRNDNSTVTSRRSEFTTFRICSAPTAFSTRTSNTSLKKTKSSLSMNLPAGKFIDNDDFVFFNDVLDVLVENAVGAEQIRNVVNSLRLLVTVLLSFRFLFVFLFV